MRVSCFHDEWMQHHKGKEMSIRGKWGGVYPIGWLDPSNEMAQKYLIDLAKEAMDAGVDEIELDYVRYPVIGIKNADFKLAALGKTKPEVIRDFVREVHAVTKARQVPLSLDIFGVVAGGKRIDIDMFGQDIALLGPECEALSPMVYPSHYDKGFMGFEIPGNHPELVGVGTKGTRTQLDVARDADADAGRGAARPAGRREALGTGRLVRIARLRAPVPRRRRAEERGRQRRVRLAHVEPVAQDYSTAWAAVPKKAPKSDVAYARPTRSLNGSLMTMVSVTPVALCSRGRSAYAALVLDELHVVARRGGGDPRARAPSPAPRSTP